MKTGHKKYTKVEKNIYELTTWNGIEYDKPTRGAAFYARKQDIMTKQRVSAAFNSLEEARLWLTIEAVVGPNSKTTTINRRKHEDKKTKHRNWYSKDRIGNAAKARFSRYKREPNRVIAKLRADLANGRIELDEFVRQLRAAIERGVGLSSGKKETE